MLSKKWENMQHLNMLFGLYEKLFNDETLLRPHEYIFLYTSSLNVTNRNKTREKELERQKNNLLVKKITFIALIIVLC